ncbi:MAG: FG-GAP-like repeat-containing protein [Candidatus Thermoplasmatota archaeon]|nr:FG-GAP-like repeat-containing protein [Candidatus Thermoplasmatota archaeon]
MKNWSLHVLIVVCFLLPSLAFTASVITISDGVEMSEPSRDGPVTFSNVSVEVGLSGVTGNQFSWGDMDNDGHEDLLVDGKRLFRNSGPPEYIFTEVTSHAGIQSQVRSGVWGDIDNDGWLDLFCGGGNPWSDHPTHPDVLWHNQKDGTFERVLPENGAPWDTFPTVASGWADMDRDGFLDIYMVNYENRSLAGYPDHFWLNNGDGTFRNATSTSGMSEEGHPYQGRGVSWSDYDMDGFMDAYVSNYRIMPNYLYHNLGDGTMEEIAVDAGVEGHGNVHPITRDGPYYGHSVGSTWGDLDNDGDMDLWVTNLAHKDPWRGPICDDSYLFENLGADQGWSFADRREASGIPIKQIPGAVGGGDELMVSSAMADYDNDGDLDLFIPQIYKDISYAYSYLYRNDGDFTFTDVSAESGIRVWDTYGSAWCDYNEDGWMDLVTGGGTWNQELERTTDRMVHLYRNDGSGSHWVEVELEGRGSNSPAIGARVEIRTDQDGDGQYDTLSVREVQGGTAAQGQQDSMVLHFGLGNQVKGMELTVHWPMGRTSSTTNVSSDSRVRLFEPTEPIDLEFNIFGYEPGPSGSKLEIEVKNPSDQIIGFTEIAIELKRGVEIENLICRPDDPIDPGTSVFEIELPGQDKDDRINITFKVNRTYPPATGKLTGGTIYDPFLNSLPVPGITGPGEGSVGEMLEFSGENSFDPDGSVSSYLFDMGDGTVIGWTSRYTASHSYDGPGEFTVRLSVKDDKDAVSVQEAVITVVISGDGPRPPTARIIEIEPVDAFIGEDVMFEGEGIPGPGARIVEHEWTSSIDGLLSSRSTFDTDELSEGRHSVEYRVKDSDGLWSIPDRMDVIVSKPYVEPIWVKIKDLEIEGPCSGIIEFKGSTGPLFSVERVEVRVDSGLWDNVWMVPDWEYRVDCSGLSDGVHRIDVRAYGSGVYSATYATYEFEVRNQEEVQDGMDAGEGSTGSFEFSIEIVYIGVVLIFIVIAVLFIRVLLRRKKRSLTMRFPEDDL